MKSVGNDVGDYTFNYDHTGLLKEVENPFGVTLYFKYDDRGFRTLVEDSFGGRVASDYNDAGQLLSRVYSDNSPLELRIDSAYDDLGRVITQAHYYTDAEGTQLVATSEYSYTEEGRLNSLEHSDAAEFLIADYVWDWDAVGQLISQNDHGVTREYDYDEQGQLISEDIDQTLTEWDYDTNGNRNTTGYSVGTGNRILSDGVWDYSYDDEGNLTEKDEINGDLRWTYGYDHANQLVEVKSYDGQSLLDEILFRYDVFGNRVEKEVNPAPVGPSELIERYVYDGWNPLKPTPIGNENWDVVIDINDMGSLTRRYLRGDVVDELFARVEGGTDALWLLGDHLGSIRDVIDDSGNPVKSVEYDAWGNIISQTGTGELGRYTYTSREWDVETQLQYNRARYYDPALGRWITQDPIGFEAGDSNLYRYANNRPTVATDPSGLQTPQLVADVKKILQKVFSSNQILKRRVNTYHRYLEEALGTNKQMTIPVEALFFAPEYGGFNTDGLKRSEEVFKRTNTSIDFHILLKVTHGSYKLKKGNDLDFDAWLEWAYEDYASGKQEGTPIKLP